MNPSRRATIFAVLGLILLSAVAYSTASGATLNGFIGGTAVGLVGTGFEAKFASPSDQKVIFHFRLQRNAEVTERDIEAAPLFPPGNGVIDERGIAVLAPSLEGLGFGKSQGYWLLEASVYVRKGYQKSASLPIRYCSSTSSEATIAGSGPCW